MNTQKDQLDTLREIRSLMEQSSRFLSLSGFSGIIAGFAALVGVVTAYYYMGLSLIEPVNIIFLRGSNDSLTIGLKHFLLIEGLIILLIALIAAALLSFRKAQKYGYRIWDSTAKRLVINMAIPLGAGGVYCAILIYHNAINLVAPATLIFYGLALLNASKFTLNDVRYLGILQVVLGLIASYFIEYGLLIWAFGFGILHIVYGTTMYLKYEK